MRRAPSSPRRKVQILLLREDLRIVEMRGNVPTRLRKLAADPSLDGILLAKAGLDRLGREVIPAGLHVAVVERILPAPGQGAIAVECRKSDLASIELLRCHSPRSDGGVCRGGTRFPARARRWVSRRHCGLGDNRGWKIDSAHLSTFMKAGICYLVGAGPGDPGLFTIKGRACLERAEVVVYDYLCNPLLLKWAPDSAEKIYVGKKAGTHTRSQEEINALLVEKARSGKIIVRLKGGDPFLFGRGGEEAEALADAGCLFEVVPGVTSAIAGPAYAGIPVTHRAHNAALTIFTGHEEPGKANSALATRRSPALQEPRSC